MNLMIQLTKEEILSSLFHGYPAKKKRLTEADLRKLLRIFFLLYMEQMDETDGLNVGKEQIL